MNNIVQIPAAFIKYPEPLTRIDYCENHGEFENVSERQNVWKGCPHCKEEAVAAEKTKRRKEQDQAWQNRLENANIPRRYWNHTLASFIADSDAKRKALDFATAYLEDFDTVRQTGRCAVFIGHPGTGKTHLACAIGLGILRRYNCGVIYTTAQEMIRRVRDTWRKDSQISTTDLIAAWTRTGLLILDEVGVQNGSENEKNILFEVIDGRYRAMLPTLILSNQECRDVEASIGERAFDRLRENGGELVIFDWSSQRGAITAKPHERTTRA